jgi:chlorite dismutase
MCYCYLEKETFCMDTPNKKIISFVGSDQGDWRISSMVTLKGGSIPSAKRLTVVPPNSSLQKTDRSNFNLKGVISNLRYTSGDEKKELNNNALGLNLPGFDCAALIPIKKSDEWWALPQDERRKIFEEDSKHIATSIRYLNRISRQLHHSRDIGEEFDFLTWFEFSSENSAAFDDLCTALRGTKEWEFVTREIDIRLNKK